MNAHTVGVTGALRDRFVLLVVPLQATRAAAATAMAMAADPASSVRPADLLAASGLITGYAGRLLWCGPGRDTSHRGPTEDVADRRRSAEEPVGRPDWPTTRAACGLTTYAVR
jgi:hypothetical protein